MGLAGWPLVCAATVILSGCAGASGAIEPAGPADAALDPADISATHGAVIGTVVDTSLLPIQNATVTLATAGKDGVNISAATTNGGGAFGFSLLEPGSYRLRAGHPDFGNGSVLVSVSAAERTSAQILLDELASDDPYLVTLIKNGFLSCAAGTLIAPTNNRCPGDQGNSTIRFEIPDGFRYFLSESEWEGQEELSQYFYSLVRNGTRNESRTIKDLWGRSVLSEHFRPGEAKTTGNPGTNTLITNAPVPAKAFRLTVTAYYSGFFGEELNQTLNPVCRPVYARCAGVGVTLGLRYTQYLTIFIHGVPDDVEEFSAIPDK